MDGYIEVTGCNLVDLIKKAYALSVPQGLGFLHFKADELSDDEAQSLIKPQGYEAVYLDYVRGRACKLHVIRDSDGKLWTPSHWYDHTDSALTELLEHVGIKRPVHAEAAHT